MKTLKVGLYKNSKSLFGNLIRWKQSKEFPGRYSQYTHIELVFEDGASFSSSEQDKGVRFKNIDFKPEKWDFIEIVVTDRQYKKILKWCTKQVGNNYNWIGIVLATIFNFNIKGNGDWFCSEIVTRALQEGGMLAVECALFVKPAKLAYILERGEYVIDN